MPGLTRRSVLAALPSVVASAAQAPAPSPNVLLVISDQLHHRAIAAAGNSVIQTPNMDRLARQGARFESALCPTPFCSPTRASLMTGMYPHQHGIVKNLRTDDAGLDQDLPTTEQTLMNAGYVARQFGKWHLAQKTHVPAYAQDPEVSYREHFRTIARGMPEPGPGPVSRVGRPIYATEAVHAANAKFEGDGPSNRWIGRTDVPPDQTEESWIADRAVEALRQVAGRPFFLTVSFPAPHALWVINEPYYSLHRREDIRLPDNRRSVQDPDRETPAWRFGQLLGDKGMREYLGVYYGMVSMMDANLGRLLDELRDLGERDNTLVIFTSDHGDMQGGHGMYDKTSYSMYEETTRVPLMMRLPGRIPAGRTVTTQAGTCDISPTILDYLDLALPGSAAGQSLRGYIEGREDLERPMFAERDRSAWGSEGSLHFQRLIRTLQWKYCYHSRGDSQLFNLANDPGETRNMVHDRAASGALLRLHSELVRWMAETNDPRAAQVRSA